MAQTKQLACKSTGGKAPHKYTAAATTRKAALEGEGQLKCKFKTGTVVLREIRKYQKITELLLREK